MGLNQTPSSERIHIGFFGRRNAGKSSVVNAVTGQTLAVVSEIKGTTTDPVQKSMELLPIGPVMIIDTPGIDDEGALGELRIERTKQVLRKTDVAVLVVDALEGLTEADRELTALFREKNIKYLIIYNKMDLLTETPKPEPGVLFVSAKTGEGIEAFKNRIGAMAAPEAPRQQLVGDLIEPLDFVVLVVPIDQAAPKGRLILPQQQTIRDILERGGVSIVVKDSELKETLARLGKKPKLVITDSQVFAKADADTPREILLTSFSILFARYKGDLETVVQGAAAIRQLKDGDQVLISEGCTHHRQCGDIGSEKLPGWLKEFTGKQLSIRLSSGTEFPENLEEYRLVIHCGGCMLNEREMKYRLKCAKDAGVPITNYGISIAYMKGILKRSLKPFPRIAELLEADEPKGGR